MADTALPSWETLSSDPDFQKLSPDERIDALDSWREQVATQAPVDASSDVLESLDSYVNQQRAIISAASSTLDVSKSLEVGRAEEGMTAGAASAQTANVEPPSNYLPTAGMGEIRQADEARMREQALNVPYPSDLAPKAAMASDVDKGSAALEHKQVQEQFIKRRDQAVAEANKALGHGVSVSVNDNNVLTLNAPQDGDEEIPTLFNDDQETLDALRAKLATISGDAEKAGTPLLTNRLKATGAKLGPVETGLLQTAGGIMDQAAGLLGSLRKLDKSGSSRVDQMMGNKPDDLSDFLDVPPARSGLEASLASGAFIAKEVASGKEGALGNIARSAGNIAGLMVGNPAGGLGLVVGALRAGAEAYSSTLTATGSESEANRAAVLTAPMMLAYIGAGKIAAGLASRIAGQEASALSRSLLGFAGAEVANVGTSAVIRALEAPEGKRVDAALAVNAANLAADTLFAVIHGIGEYRDLPPELKTRAMNEAERRGFTPEQLREPPIEGEFTIVSPDEQAPSTALLLPDQSETPIIVTDQMRGELKSRGFSDEQITALPGQEVLNILAKPSAIEQAQTEAQTALVETGATETAKALAEVDNVGSADAVSEDVLTTTEAIPKGGAEAPAVAGDQTPVQQEQPVASEAPAGGDQPIVDSRIRGAMLALRKRGGGFDDVYISDVAKESGVPLSEVHEWIREQGRAGEVIASKGDWSLSSDDTHAGALEMEGEPHLQIRLSRYPEQDALDEGHAPEAAAEIQQQAAETTPAPTPEQPATQLSPEQYDALNYSVRAAADRFTWRNEAEKDSHIATVLSEVERRAGDRVAQRGNLEGFAPSVVAMSRFRDILRKAETQRTGNIEPVTEGSAAPEPVSEAPDPAEQIAREETAARVRNAVSALGGDEGRLLQYHLDNPGTSIAQSAADLGIQEDRARRLYVKAAAKLRSQLKADHDAMLQLAFIPGLQEFIQQDVLTASSSLLKGVADAFQQTRAALAPASFGGTASIAAGAGREQLAIMARKYEMAAEAMKGAKKMFEKLPESFRLEFIDRMETGKPQPTPELATIAKQLRDAFAERVRQVRAVNPKALKTLITDYFPHIWQDANAATSWYQKTFGRRPLEGSKDFIKKRTIPTTMDGINAGLVPVSTNPIELTLLKLREIDRYVMAHQWTRELKQQGIMQYVPKGSTVPNNWVKVDDRMAQAWQKNPNGHGMILHGEWYAPAEAARILNNYLSPGLKGFKLYDGFRWLGNALNQVQLGMSFFHMLFVSLDSATSKAALGVVQMGRGRVAEGMFNFSKGVLGNVFVNPLETAWKGSKVLKEYYQPGSVGGEVGEIVKALVQSGGRVKMDSFFQTGAVHSFMQALKGKGLAKSPLGRSIEVLARAPFTAIDMLSHPLLNELVPRMKLGVFYDLAHEELRDLRARGITDLQGTREALGKVWDSVDNRMGQLVYDNLFWHRLLKDGLMASVRSVGWNLGDIRELGGGFVDAATAPRRAYREGASRAVTHRIGYLVALPFTVGLLGALYQYMKTGHGPGQRKQDDGTIAYAGTGEAIRDMMMPRTGRRLPDGSDERIVLPSYLKDLKAYATHPLQTLSHKSSPAISMVVDMLNNHDYFGTEIRNEDSGYVTQAKDIAEFIVKQFRPFTFQAMGRREGDDVMTKIESFVGLQPPPANLLRTPAMNKLMELARNHMPSIRTATDTEKQDAKREAKKEARRQLFGEDQPTTFPELRRAAAAALDEKMITTRDYAQLNNRIANRQFANVPEAIDFLAQRADPRVALFKRLSPEEGGRVLRLADPEEMAIWKPLMDKKEKDSARTQKREAARSNARRAALDQQEAMAP